MLKLDERSLVHRANQLAWTLQLHASAETVAYASRTVEDGGRERLLSGSEPKPVSADQIHSKNPVSKHQIQPEYGDEQADAGRDG